MTIEIPRTNERVEMRLSEDDCGVLYLQHSPSGMAIYSLRAMLDLGWQIVNSTPAERALLDAHGLGIAP
jgi:hypothetical protein